jgi:transcriptional regulator with XRE-family HTH domain
MSPKFEVTGRLIAAGRALVEVGREDFAKAAGLSVEALTLLEAGGSAWVDSEDDAEAIVRAFDTFGIVIVDEADGLGAGVRLKFTRQDVKQIVRLETEAGMSRPDDAP